MLGEIQPPSRAQVNAQLGDIAHRLDISHQTEFKSFDPGDHDTVYGSSFRSSIQAVIRAVPDREHSQSVSERLHSFRGSETPLHIHHRSPIQRLWFSERPLSRLSLIGLLWVPLCLLDNRFRSLATIARPIPLIRKGFALLRIRTQRRCRPTKRHPCKCLLVDHQSPSSFSTFPCAIFSRSSMLIGSFSRKSCVPFIVE